MDVEGIFAGRIDTGAGAEVGDFFEGGDEFGAAVGVAGVIDGVDAEEDVECIGGFGEGESEGEEDGVACGDVGDGDGGVAGIGLIEVVFGDGDVSGEGGTSEGAEVDFHGDMARELILFGEGVSGFNFLLVALAVVEAEGMADVALGDGDAESGGGIETAGEKDDCIFVAHGGQFTVMADGLHGFNIHGGGAMFLIYFRG